MKDVKDVEIIITSSGLNLILIYIRNSGNNNYEIVILEL